MSLYTDTLSVRGGNQDIQHAFAAVGHGDTDNFAFRQCGVYSFGGSSFGFRRCEAAFEGIYGKNRFSYRGIISFHRRILFSVGR